MRRFTIVALAALILASPTWAQTLQPSFVQPLGVSPKALARIASESQALTKETPSAQDWEAALRFADRDPNSFKAALRLAIEHPQAFAALEATGDLATRAVFLALQTTRFDDLTRLLLGIADSAERDKALIAAAALRQRIELAASQLSPRTQVAVLADGNIRGIATGKPGTNTAATGSLGLRVTQGRSIWGAQINVASTIDTANSGFAQTLLSPGTGATLLAGLLDYRFRAHDNWGVHAYSSISRSIWLDTATVKPLNHPAAAASVVGVGFLFYFQPFLDPEADNPVSFSVEAGPTLRVIGGDIASADSLRKRLLNDTSRRTFGGLEAGFQLSFNDVTGALQVYFIRGAHVDGVTGLQVTAGFSIHAAVFTKVFGGTKPLSALGQ